MIFVGFLKYIYLFQMAPANEKTPRESSQFEISGWQSQSTFRPSPRALHCMTLAPTSLSSDYHPSSSSPSWVSRGCYALADARTEPPILLRYTMGRARGWPHLDTSFHARKSPRCRSRGRQSMQVDEILYHQLYYVA